MKWLSIGILLFITKAHAQLPNPGAMFNSNSFMYLNTALNSNNLIGPVANAWNTKNLPKYYSTSVTTTGSGFTILLEGSLDTLNWQTISTLTTINGITSNTNPIPALYLRLRASSMSANTTVTATAIGVW